MVGVLDQPIGNGVTMATDHRRTDARIAQGTLLEEPGFLKEIVGRVLQELLEAEMTEHIGAAPYERGEGRTGHRNGHKPRTLRTKDKSRHPESAHSPGP
jgi:putative transposase